LHPRDVIIAGMPRAAHPPARKSAASKRRVAQHAEYAAPQPPDAGLRLTRTDSPEVFRNAAGDLVDRHGVLLGFGQLKSLTSAAEVAVLGKAAETPAEVLKFAALNPAYPLAFRIEAAKAAAPYYDRKRPVAVDGGEDPDNPSGLGVPLGGLLADLKGLSAADLGALHALLSKASV
jgi:hypothetical protein